MRKARFKLTGQPAFYHLYNRVAGEPGFYPFGRAEKENFVRLMRKLQKYYSVKVLSYQIMSNHFHLKVFAPAKAPNAKEVVRRYRAYYGKNDLDASDPRCAELAERMRDISCFMHAVQQQFAMWYNRTRSTPRRGPLWAGRFKNTLLGGAVALWRCWKYIEMNSFRAGLVQDPADYRFGSYGTWSVRGRHPFEEHVREVLMPVLRERYGFASMGEVYQGLRQAFREACGRKPESSEGDDDLTARLNYRVRHWVDGLVIGSERFVRDAVAGSGGVLRSRTGAFLRVNASGASGLVSYNKLRAG